MKLLLTSQGLFNRSIADALFDLAGNPASEMSIAFVPTGVNVTSGDKSWFVEIISMAQANNFKFFDIVDYSALPKENWLPRLEAADVIFFCGGNTSHIMNTLKESGLDKILPELLKTRVYVGNSASAMIMCPTILFSSEKKKDAYEKEFGYKSEEGLGLVNFYLRPHLNRSDSPHSAKEIIEEKSKSVKEVVYLLDDDSAVKVDGDNIEVISEGEYYIFNEN